MAHHNDYKWVICTVCGKKFRTRWEELYCSAKCAEKANEYIS